jgi:hypothetical protein
LTSALQIVDALRTGIWFGKIKVSSPFRDTIPAVYSLETSHDQLEKTDRTQTEVASVIRYGPILFHGKKNYRDEG